MAKPSHKSEEMEQSLQDVLGFDRRESISEDRCAPPPIGCGQPAPPESFKDELSRREFTISGMCQTCQDEVFG